MPELLELLVRIVLIALLLYLLSPRNTPKE